MNAVGQARFKNVHIEAGLHSKHSMLLTLPIPISCSIIHAGMFLPVGRERDELTRTLASKSSVPVYLDAKTVDLYYNGFCNSVLWSLFHYVPLQTDSRLSETRTLQFQWAAYQEANRR